MTTILLILSLIQAVTVRGIVWEGDDKPAADATVTIVGANGTLETTSGKDGTFKFSLPKPGNFELSARRGRLVGHPSTIFVGQDMDGIGIVLQPVVNHFVLGSVKVEDDLPLPTPLPKILIQYASGSPAGRFDVNPRGLFFFGASPVEFNVSLEGLSEPYFVKSMTFGDLDLTKNPMKLTSGAVTKSIVITLGKRK